MIFLVQPMDTATTGATPNLVATTTVAIRIITATNMGNRIIGVTPAKLEAAIGCIATAML